MEVTETSTYREGYPRADGWAGRAIMNAALCYGPSDHFILDYKTALSRGGQE